MADKTFVAWFSDVGFTCRVLIICDMLEEFTISWGAHWNSAFSNAIKEVRETAILEMMRYDELGRAAGFFAGPEPPDAGYTEKVWGNLDDEGSETPSGEGNKP